MEKSVRMAEVKQRESSRDRSRLQQEEQLIREQRHIVQKKDSELKEQKEELDREKEVNCKHQQRIEKLLSEKKRLKRELDCARQVGRRHPCVSSGFSMDGAPDREGVDACGRAMSLAKRLQRTLPKAAPPQAHTLLGELVREVQWIQDRHAGKTYASGTVQ